MGLAYIKKIFAVFFIEAIFLLLTGTLTFAVLKIIGRIIFNLNKISFNAAELFVNTHLIEENLGILAAIKLKLVLALIIGIVLVVLLYSISNWLIWMIITKKKIGLRFIVADFSAAIILVVLLVLMLIMFQPAYFLALSVLPVALFLHYLACLHVVFASAKHGFSKSLHNAFVLATTFRAFAKPYGLVALVALCGLAVAVVASSILGAISLLLLVVLFYVCSIWLRFELFEGYTQ